MRTFTITTRYTVVCETKKTRMAFKHEATLLCNGRDIESTKICYCNRTWESYEYESILEKLFDQVKGQLTKYELGKFRKVIKNGGKRDMDNLRSVRAVALMGNIFCETQKEKNDWKERMLKAGLGNMGLTMPDDWETLSEDEKERRLNAATEVLA